MVAKRYSVVLLFVLLCAFPGCPGSTGLGIWAFLVYSPTEVSGLDLRANGQAVPVDLGGPNFGGTLTWERVTNTEIIIRQTNGNGTFVYYGELDTPTTMTGGQVQLTGALAGDGQLFTASKT